MKQLFQFPVAAIVVAAGSGSRLGCSKPKALVTVAGVPLVVRAVDALQAGGVTNIVVVAPPGRVSEVQELFEPDVQVIEGGAERQDSVRLGLSALGPTEIVLVHDAARALMPATVISAVIEAVRNGANAVVPVMPVVDSIREVNQEGNRVVDRSSLCVVQTPQGFKASLLRRAHEYLVATAASVTDDAAACELLGEKIVLVPGDRQGMKITEPLDLVLAETIISRR